MTGRRSLARRCTSLAVGLGELAGELVGFWMCCYGLNGNGLMSEGDFLAGIGVGHCWDSVLQSMRTRLTKVDLVVAVERLKIHQE